jgi:hypothetical protein
VIKSRRIRRGGYVTQVRDMRNYNKIIVFKPEETRPLESVRLDKYGRIILKLSFLVMD